MTLKTRLLLAAAIVAIDLVLVVVPLTALAIAYVLLANPPWFHEFARRLKEPPAPIR